METKTVNVRGRTFTIAKRHEDEHWFELKPERNRGVQSVATSRGVFGTRPPSPPRRPPTADVATLRRELLSRLDATPPASPPLPWRLGQYGENVPVEPSHRNVQLAGYCIQWNVLSKPHPDGWRDVVRSNALDMACRHRTPLWIHHLGKYVVDRDAKLTVDSYGLKVESFGAATHNPQLHASVLKMTDEGELSGMSVSLPGRECGYYDHPAEKIREFFFIPQLREVSLCGCPQWPGTRLSFTDQWRHSRQKSYDPYLHSMLQTAIEKYDG